MKYRDCYIAWTPARDRLKKGRASPGGFEHYTGRTAGHLKIYPITAKRSARNYAYTGGPAVFSHNTDIDSDWRLIALMLIDLHNIVVRDGVDPQVCHKAFLEIDEYREIFPPDMNERSTA
jgi:hypothetical protein